MHPLAFFTFLVFTLVTIVSIVTGYPYTGFPIIFVFLFIPLLDYILGVRKRNPTLHEEQSWKNAKIWTWAVYLYVISHFLVLSLALFSAQKNSVLQVVVLGVVVGLYTGGLGITVTHELCHKQSKIHRFFADVLLSSVWYGHFSVEHVRGHHFQVATMDDPASARRNESVYQFLPRTLKDSFLHALSIDKMAVIRGLLYSLVMTVCIYLFFKFNGFLFFLIQSGVAILLLELVNYVEHYGLTRQKLQNGRYEKVRVEHSWNSSHLFSSLLLFNLQRHSDHHAAANLPYTVLKHQETAPQLPSGYPGMILLALFPKLWFRHMNKLLESYEGLNQKT
jgi:alkane 1-monooxygenase